MFAFPSKTHKATWYWHIYNLFKFLGWELAKSGVNRTMPVMFLTQKNKVSWQNRWHDLAEHWGMSTPWSQHTGRESLISPFFYIHRHFYICFTFVLLVSLFVSFVLHPLSDSLLFTNLIISSSSQKLLAPLFIFNLLLSGPRTSTWLNLLYLLLLC